MALAVRRTDTTTPSQAGAPLARWEPFRELEQLQEQMGRFIDSVWAPAGAGNGGPWMPLADIEETEDAWIVELEAPGVDRRDITVELSDGELTITGEIKEKERTGVVRRRTRRVGRFEYRVALPGEFDAEHIEASVHDGVLTVRLPKTERAQTRRIEVKG